VLEIGEDAERSGRPHERVAAAEPGDRDPQPVAQIREGEPVHAFRFQARDGDHRAAVLVDERSERAVERRDEERVSAELRALWNEAGTERPATDDASAHSRAQLHGCADL